MLARLTTWGVRRVFGYPGDGINGFLGAFDRADGEPEFIQVRHEEMSAFMACGHAKFTGELGVCVATSGPGAIHLLNGLYDAKLDHQPVLAVVGQQQTTALGSDYQQEVDLLSLFKDVSEYVHVCANPVQARHLVDRAVRTALSQHGVATLIFPSDVQAEDAVKLPAQEHGSVFSSAGWSQPRVVPGRDELERAAGILNEGEKVAILVGQGAREAAEEVIETADTLGAGVAKALLGKSVLPDDLPFVTGPIGLLGSQPSYELMSGCDTLLMVGTSFPYAEWLPKPGQARGIEIDLDGRNIGIRYPMNVHLVGDARETLRALLPLLRQKDDRAWRDEIESNVSEWWQILEEQALQDAEPMNPQRVVWELSQQLPDNAIVTGDAGSTTNWLARFLRLGRGNLASLSGGLASMGSAVPYAIAAKLALPERPVVAILGDGAFQMNGMNELLTVKRYWERYWSESPTLIVCVFDNQDLNMVTWEQRAMAGDPKYPASQSLPSFDYAGYAELCGLKGVRCESGELVADAWDEAFSADRPAVLHVTVDAEVPPLPPHITFEQTRLMTEALLKGDPEGIGITRKSFRSKLAELKRTLTP